jgi:hypothetical protein
LGWITNKQLLHVWIYYTILWAPHGIQNLKIKSFQIDCLSHFSLMSENENINSKRKEIVDAKYGAGSYEKAILRLNPHRCAPHMNEIFYGLQHRTNY